jgi:glycosyltransferase involved in cell wall biosynthesis
MKIGFDAKRAFNNRSGLGNYSRSTLRLLSQFYPDNKYYLFSGNANQNLFQPTVNQHSIEPEGWISERIPSLWRTWAIYREIKEQQIDIYHGLSNEIPLSIKKSGVKSVVTIHDLIFLRYPEYYPLIDKQIYSIKFRHACRVADKIIATSEATKQDIIRFFRTEPSKIEVVYQTCDAIFRSVVNDFDKQTLRIKYNLPERFILYLGTIEKRKNALTLIKAYLKGNHDIPLLIAGKPTAYLNEINSYLEDNSGKDRIIFRHNIESADLPALYQASRLFVYPSVFEGFGIPILEALYSGVPVLTSTGSCFAETGGDAAMYCDPLDEDHLSDCISKILSDESTRKLMIEKGFLHSRKFDEAKVAANLMNVYLDL